MKPSVYIREELKKVVDVIAAKSGQTKGEVVEEAIVHYYDEEVEGDNGSRD